MLAPTGATDRDVSNLYYSTMTEAHGSEASEAQRESSQIDLLEPTGFERWVLQQLAEAGYDTRATPRSGDRGADGLALSRGGKQPHTIIVQCKHMQPDAKCGQAAVEEVLRSIPNYETVGDPRPMVVTNGAGFTADAVRLARHKSVQLVDRGKLSQLRTWNGLGG